MNPVTLCSEPVTEALCTNYLCKFTRAEPDVSGDALSSRWSLGMATAEDISQTAGHSHGNFILTDLTESTITV